MIPELYEGETVLIVGNAASALRRRRKIPPEWKVCRLNRGFPKKRRGFIGSRTDIIATSTPLNEETVAEEYGLWHKGELISMPDLVWMTPSDHRLKDDDFWKDQARYPRDRWEKLQKALGGEARPSTGMMAIDYFCYYIKPAKIYLLGFDHGMSHTFYWTDKQKERGHPHTHSYPDEERLIDVFYRPFCNLEYLK